MVNRPSGYEIIKWKDFMSNQKNAFYKSVTELVQNKNYKKAFSELEAFFRVNPDDEIALSIYGGALLRSGDKDKAIETLKHAVAIYPNSYAAHADLAFVSENVGDSVQAIKSFEKVAQLNQNFYPAWALLGKLYFENKQYSKATAALENAEKSDPLDNDYRLMQKAMRDGDFAKGEQIARDMLKKQPGHPRAAFMLAHIASKVGAHEERADILRYCLSYHPANQIVRKELIISYEEMGDYDLAKQEADILLEVEKSYLNYWIKSRIFGHLGDHESALKSAENAASCIEDNDEELGKVDLLRGHALKILGRRKECEEAYKSCLKNTPDNGAGWWGLADLKNYQFTAEDKEAMEKMTSDENVNIAQRCQAAFALAKALENDGSIDEAFSWYRKANDMRPDLDFDPEENIEYCDNYISISDASMLEKQALPLPKGPTPIFIVGMPRAGSTLIEQILSSHSQIEGTMELPTLPKLERRIKLAGGKKFKQHYPECLKNFNESELSAFGQMYLDQTAVYRKNKPYFIDKLPPNFERIGLIHKILPQAIIIDARRHPFDCGYSAYKQHFAGGHEYSYNLRNIGNYYNGYLKFMDHWNDVLPDKVLTVQYENMVRDTEGTTRTILEHIGVPFEESCLRFYENKRAVKTASSEQVRQPIYTKGIGQWQPVEDQLTPLFESLGDETLKRFEEFLPKNIL
tara:strand:+ start:107153 stop:109219 length:2067 start_codon:yes stop_codon:yes gene_type:complete